MNWILQLVKDMPIRPTLFYWIGQPNMPRIKYQSAESVIKPAIEEVLKRFVIQSPKTLADELVDAVLKAQRKHNHEVMGE